MKNKKAYIVIAIIVFVVVMIIPFISNDFVSERLRVSANLLSGLGSCITLIIAILLFNKYGIDKTIIDKKKEIILDILENVKKTSIEIEYREAHLFYRPGFPYHSVYEDYYKVNLLFDHSYFHGLDKIFKHTKNLYTPKRIIDKISSLEPLTMSFVNENPIDFGKVLIQGVKSENNFGHLNSSNFTFYEFMTFWDDLINECTDWLKVNAGEQIELNID